VVASSKPIRYIGTYIFQKDKYFNQKISSNLEAEARVARAFFQSRRIYFCYHKALFKKGLDPGVYVVFLTHVPTQLSCLCRYEISNMLKNSYTSIKIGTQAKNFVSMYTNSYLGMKVFV
jgi:hypothetical protein